MTPLVTTTTISVGDAKSRFSELISRALAGERFVVRRRDKVVAAIIGPDDFDRLEERRKAVVAMSRALGQSENILSKIESGELHPAMAAYGLLAHEPEWDAIVTDIYKKRKRKSKRPVVNL